MKIENRESRIVTSEEVLTESRFSNLDSRPAQALEAILGQFQGAIVPRRLREMLLQKFPAVTIARVIYKMGGRDFDEDLQRHLETGYVVSRPWCFLMCEAVQLEETDEPAWLVNIAVGRLAECIGVLPYYLPKVTFYRRRRKARKVVDLERVAQLAKRLENRK